MTVSDPEKFETYVRFVYEALLNLHGEGVQVAHRAKVGGRSGSWYEIDVYYQFVRAGITHQVAFECKNWKRPVDRDAVLAFHGKLSDIGNIHGVLVSRTGFQRGTKEYAAHYGIDIRTLDDLPTFRETLATRVASVILPNPKKRPEPFWCLQAKDGAGYHDPADKSGSPIRQFRVDISIKSHFLWDIDKSQTGSILPDNRQPHGIPLSH